MNESLTGNQLCAAESRLSLPLELLAGEWLQHQGRGGGTEDKSYLMDSLLPTLILGMEKLLTEVACMQCSTREFDLGPQTQHLQTVLAYFIIPI